MCTTIIEEEWRDIAGYEGIYQVSNLGRIKSLGNDKSRKEKILKPVNNSDGYPQVTLYKNRKREQVSVHRLVADTFIQNPDNLPQVNHKDENTKNNRVDNLEWCTPKYNSNYGTHNERIAKSLINRKGRSKPILCVETGVIFQSAMEAERHTGANSHHITKCCRGKYGYKTSGGYHWKYCD